jgi:hypothetical protein
MVDSYMTGSWKLLAHYSCVCLPFSISAKFYGFYWIFLLKRSITLYFVLTVTGETCLVVNCVKKISIQKGLHSCFVILKYSNALEAT